LSNSQEIVGFIWPIADEVLRDDFKRGKYPDVILPFTVLRRALHKKSVLPKKPTNVTRKPLGLFVQNTVFCDFLCKAPPPLRLRPVTH
jgi:hypothetical protein